MPKHWLQVKGDPSIRSNLFNQCRQVSLFDENIDKLHHIMKVMVTEKGVFHIKAHYSSSQLTCWFIDAPLDYRIYVKEEIFASDFLDQLPTTGYEARKPLISVKEFDPITDEFKRLRLTDEQIYLRSGSVNRMNRMIGMNFSCDGTHYINHEEFFQRLDSFAGFDD